MLRFALPRSADASVVVFDSAGVEIKRLFDGELGAGEHVFVWHGEGSTGQGVGAGVYVLRLDAGGRPLTARTVQIR